MMKKLLDVSNYAIKVILLGYEQKEVEYKTPKMGSPYKSSVDISPV